MSLRSSGCHSGLIRLGRPTGSPDLSGVPGAHLTDVGSTGALARRQVEAGPGVPLTPLRRSCSAGLLPVRGRGVGGAAGPAAEASDAQWPAPPREGRVSRVMGDGRV